MADELVLRQSTLLGRLILDYETTNELGLVDGLLVDVGQAQVVGLLARSNVWQRQQPYGWGQIGTIGADSLIIHTRGPAFSNSAAQPMIGLEVWTDTGNCMGKLVDYRFERQGAVVQYLFAQPDKSGLYGLGPDAIISAGRKRVMVSTQAVEQAEYFADELDQNVWQATAQTTAQSIVDQVQQRAQGWSDYAQEQWLTEDLNEQLQSTTRQLQERTQGLRSQLNQQVSNAKKRIKPLNRALENTFENALDKLNDPGEPTEQPAIDLESFEVWEDDD